MRSLRRSKKEREGLNVLVEGYANALVRDCHWGKEDAVQVLRSIAYFPGSNAQRFQQSRRLLRARGCL